MTIMMMITMMINMYTVPLLKSFHIRRSLFLITGGHHILHKFRDHYSMVHLPPIIIFLLNSQKSGQMRQSNHPPSSPAEGRQKILIKEKYKYKYQFALFTIVAQFLHTAKSIDWHLPTFSKFMKTQTQTIHIIDFI